MHFETVQDLIKKKKVYIKNMQESLYNRVPQSSSTKAVIQLGLWPTKETPAFTSTL